MLKLYWLAEVAKETAEETFQAKNRGKPCDLKNPEIIQATRLVERICKPWINGRIIKPSGKKPQIRSQHKNNFSKVLNNSSFLPPPPPLFFPFSKVLNNPSFLPPPLFFPFLSFGSRTYSSFYFYFLFLFPRIEKIKEEYRTVKFH